ncbi:hypothetical protein H8S23_08365 [Anaerofilum sp. BX8]|uniref:Uncharacterized protein n=1 Tax=Anaerofilum hominis TaxID=2763016 RepID=A0A923I810_9FIRM|nr:hypothetical protein [Anaerofilum hominis]MBC5581524.1 hypothetical protein [Anaerofilum hominis]
MPAATPPSKITKSIFSVRPGAAVWPRLFCHFCRPGFLPRAFLPIGAKDEAEGAECRDALGAVSLRVPRAFPSRRGDVSLFSSLHLSFFFRQPSRAAAFFVFFCFQTGKIKIFLKNSPLSCHILSFDLSILCQPLSRAAKDRFFIFPRSKTQKGGIQDDKLQAKK